MTESISSETFDIIKAAAGNNFPSKTISFYTNYNALRIFLELEAKINNLPQDALEEIKALEDKQTELLELIQQSTITVTVRGINRKVRRQVIASSVTKGNKAEAYDYANWLLVQASLESVVDVNGNPLPNAEDLEWYDNLSDADGDRLIETIESLQLDSARFDETVGADFLSKS